MPHDHGQPQGSFLMSRTGLIFLGFVAVGGIVLFTEHRAHVLGALIWLLPLACLLMHMFGHGHGSHGSHGSHGQRNERSPT